jgi:hypothetical protein
LSINNTDGFKAGDCRAKHNLRMNVREVFFMATYRIAPRMYNSISESCCSRKERRRVVKARSWRLNCPV